MLEKGTLFSALNLFELTTRTALRCAVKKSVVRIFLASQWNQRLVNNFVYIKLHSILNSGVAGTRLPTYFCHSQSIYSVSKNPICLLASSKVNIEKMDEEPSFENNSENVESSVKIIQTEASTDVAGVNQIDITANQGNFDVGSFTQEKGPSDLEHEIKSDQYSSKEPRASEVGDEVSGLQDQKEKQTTNVECLQRSENQKSNDISGDDESFGLDTLFDEELQRRDPARWTTKSKAKSKQRKQEKRKQKQQQNVVSDDDDDIDEASASKDSDLSLKGKKKSKRIMPNYFLAIRVSNPQIHSGVKIIQDSITTHNEKLTPALIPLATLHLTLMVMHLEDAEQIQKATEILNQCRTSLEPILRNSALKLTFSGLGHFGHQVLYVKLFGEEQMEVLKSVANIVRETFTKEGIPSTDSREFSPHLTVMKLSRAPKMRKNGIKKIPEECYATLIDMDFGEEPVNALNLCSMNKKEKDGFYKCVATLTFDDAVNEPSPIEPENPITEGIAAQDSHTRDASMVQEATTRTGDEENVAEGDNIEESASCDEDLTKEIVTWTVDENMKDSIMNKQLSDVQGDSEGNGSESDTKIG